MCENCGENRANFLEGIDPADVPDGADLNELTMAAERYNAALHARCCQLWTTAWMSGVVSVLVSNGVAQDTAVEYGRAGVQRLVEDPIGRLRVEEGVRLFMEGKNPDSSVFVAGDADPS